MTPGRSSCARSSWNPRLPRDQGGGWGGPGQEPMSRQSEALEVLARAAVPAAAAAPCVLCVDDEPVMLEALSRTLGRRYAVKTAPGGAEGLRMLADHPDIAVVVADMRMPGMDGATLLQ